MPNDLEKFLTQAAERLAEKLQGRQPERQPPRRPQQPQSVRHTERQMQHYEPEIADEDVLDAELIPMSQDERSHGPSRLSQIGRSEAMANDASHADERMTERLERAFGPRTKSSSEELTGSYRSVYDSESDVSSVTVHQRDRSPLVAMFGSPGTLKAAFIAGEIFRRKV